MFAASDEEWVSESKLFQATDVADFGADILQITSLEDRWRSEEDLKKLKDEVTGESSSDSNRSEIWWQFRDGNVRAFGTHFKTDSGR